MNKRILSSKARTCSQHARNLTHIIMMYSTGVYKRLDPNVYPDDQGVSQYFSSYNNLAANLLMVMHLSNT